MAEDKKTNDVTDAGAVEINEIELDNASGGASSDYLLEIDTVKGESKDRRQTTAGYDLKAAKKV